MNRNELIVRLAKRAVAIVAPCLREDEQDDEKEDREGEVHQNHSGRNMATPR